MLNCRISTAQHASGALVALLIYGKGATENIPAYILRKDTTIVYLVTQGRSLEAALWPAPPDSAHDQ